MFGLFSKYKISAALTALIFFSGGCKVQELDFKGVNDLSVGSMESEKIEVTLNVKLNNPNGFKIKVINANLDLYIGGNEAGVATLADKVVIRKKAEDDYAITITTDKRKLMGAAFKAALPGLASGKVVVKVKGWIKGRVWGIGKKMEVEFKENVDFDMLKGKM